MLEPFSWLFSKIFNTYITKIKSSIFSDAILSINEIVISRNYQKDYKTSSGTAPKFEIS